MTANQRLLDGTISHQIDLQHYSNNVVRRIIAILNRTDPDLLAQVTVALERLDASSFTVERLDQLLYSVRSLNTQAYQEAYQELATELKDLTAYEGGFQLNLFKSAMPVEVVAQVHIAAVVPDLVYAAAMSRPFQGRLLKEWADSQDAARMARVRDAIRIGMVENQTMPQIVQRLRGTRAKGYSDGLLEIDRRAAESVTRTAVSHVAGFTRDRFNDGNKSLIKALQWVSTLDARTSSLCRIRDGLEYTPGSHNAIGHSIPWLGGPGRLHWCCRSTSAPVTKSWKELGINLDDAPPSTRASMDGQVPEDTTYGDWIKKQSAQRQDQVLGPARGKLLRGGGLELSDFYNDKGRTLTLDELRQRDAAAFKDANL